MSAVHQHSRKLIPTVVAIAALAGAGAIAGCGSSSASKKTDAQQPRATPAQSGADVGKTLTQTGTDIPAGQSKRADTGTRGADSKPASPTGAGTGIPAGRSQTVQRARQTPGTSHDEHSGTAGQQLNPCTLVSLSEAQTITGGTITGRIDAPLGPTCIYKTGGSKADITLAVESMSFARVAHQMRQQSPVLVRGHRAYCGKLGTEMLFAPLSGGRVLSVTAPCAIARRFATTALGRLVA